MADQDTSQTTPTPFTITLYYQPAFFRSFVPEHGPKPTLNPIIDFWTRHPAELCYRPIEFFSVDLTQTPSRYNPDNSCQIQIDDHVHNDGCTTIGPNFPHAYPAGGAYLSDSLLKQVVDHYIENRCKELNLDVSVRPDLTLTKERITSLIPADERIIVQWPLQPQREPERNQLTRYRGFFGQQPDPAAYASLWIVWHSGSWIDKISNSRRGTQWRAPRKLWIPNNVIYDVKTKTGGRETDDIPSIYLEQHYATEIAELNVPKQPSASGYGLFSQIDRLLGSTIRLQRQKASSQAQAQTDHINATTSSPRLSNLSVISDYSPGEIYRIREQIKQSDRVVIVQEGQTIAKA